MLKLILPLLLVSCSANAKVVAPKAAAPRPFCLVPPGDCVQRVDDKKFQCYPTEAACVQAGGLRVPAKKASR